MRIGSCLHKEQSSCSLDLLMSYITRKGRHYEHKAHPLLWQPTRSGFSAPPQGGHWDTKLVAQGSRALDWFTYYLSFQHKKLKAAKCYQKSAKINAESKKNPLNCDNKVYYWYDPGHLQHGKSHKQSVRTAPQKTQSACLSFLSSVKAKASQLFICWG